MASMTYLVLVVMAASLVDVSQSACSTGESGSCQTTIQGLYQNSPNSVSEYHSYCSSVKSTCSSTLTECTCTSGAEEQICLDFIGFKDAIDWVCTTIDVREVFTKNRECVIKSAEDTASACRLNNSENCSGYLAGFKCFHGSMKSKCNESVADKSTEFALRRYNPLLWSAKCEFGLSDISPSTILKGDDDPTRVNSIATERKSKSTASTLVSSTAFVTMALIITLM